MTEADYHNLAFQISDYRGATIGADAYAYDFDNIGNRKSAAELGLDDSDLLEVVDQTPTSHMKGIFIALERAKLVQLCIKLKLKVEASIRKGKIDEALELNRKKFYHSTLLQQVIDQWMNESFLDAMQLEYKM